MVDKKKCKCGKCFSTKSNLKRHQEQCYIVESERKMCLIEKQNEQILSLLQNHQNHPVSTTINYNTLNQVLVQQFNFAYHVNKITNSYSIGNMLEDRYGLEGSSNILKNLCYSVDGKDKSGKVKKYQNLITEVFGNDKGKIPFEIEGTTLKVLDEKGDFDIDQDCESTVSKISNSLTTSYLQSINKAIHQVTSCGDNGDTDAFESASDSLLDSFDLRKMQDFALDQKKDKALIKRAFMNHPGLIG